jgi:transcriptional regulator with XRE-family HTH domain
MELALIPMDESSRPEPVLLTTLGGFLRARREQRQPEQVGLERQVGRRVPGLRRDEVATLAGVSSEYYLRLEQGRGNAPSMQVLAGLARALRLSAAESDYLHRLAGHAAPRRVGSFERPRAEIEAILRWWPGVPAYISDANLDVVAANDLMVALTDGHFRPGANVLEETFNDAGRGRLETWQSHARDAVALFRYSGDETSARYHAILRRLSTDADFRRFWDLQEVTLPNPSEIAAAIEGVGQLTISVRDFFVPELRGHMVTVFDAAPGSAADVLFRQVGDALRAAAGAPKDQALAPGDETGANLQ